MELLTQWVSRRTAKNEFEAYLEKLQGYIISRRGKTDDRTNVRLEDMPKVYREADALS
jgi:hypothetical protein